MQERERRMMKGIKFDRGGKDLRMLTKTNRATMEDKMIADERMKAKTTGTYLEGSDDLGLVGDGTFELSTDVRLDERPRAIQQREPQDEIPNRSRGNQERKVRADSEFLYRVTKKNKTTELIEEVVGAESSMIDHQKGRTEGKDKVGKGM